MSPVTPLPRRRLLLAVGGLISGCSGKAPTSDTSCITASSGNGLPYCLVKSVQLAFPGAAHMAIGDVQLRGLDDSTAAVLLRDERVFFALSAICPHQCCTVTLCTDDACKQTVPTPNDCAPQRQGSVSRGKAAFFCPCHGSEFAKDGEVLRGPAINPLPAVKVTLSGADALVDLGVPVAGDTRV